MFLVPSRVEMVLTNCFDQVGVSSLARVKRHPAVRIERSGKRRRVLRDEEALEGFFESNRKESPG
jgi:hypothetical protein